MPEATEQATPPRSPGGDVRRRYGCLTRRPSVALASSGETPNGILRHMVASSMKETTGGRGARARILHAAAQLYYFEGINATGMDRLADVANVSKRTIYQHFSGKDALIAAYLRQFADSPTMAANELLVRTDLPALERLKQTFAISVNSPRTRGCPFHNAAVELAGSSAEIDAIISGYKHDFLRLLTKTCRQAGLRQPIRLARQLVVLYEGAAALRVSMKDSDAVQDAHDAALTLIEAHRH